MSGSSARCASAPIRSRMISSGLNESNGGPVQDSRRPGLTAGRPGPAPLLARRAAAAGQRRSAARCHSLVRDRSRCATSNGSRSGARGATWCCPGSPGYGEYRGRPSWSSTISCGWTSSTSSAGRPSSTSRSCSRRSPPCSAGGARSSVGRDRRAHSRPSEAPDGSPAPPGGDHVCCRPMPPTDRFVISFAAEPPQEALPYGRWADTLRDRFVEASREIDSEGEDLGTIGQIKWFPATSSAAAPTSPGSRSTDRLRALRVRVVQRGRRGSEPDSRRGWIHVRAGREQPRMEA